jgi:hypothetical protein
MATTTIKTTATPEAATAVESAATAASPASAALSGQRQCQQATNENKPQEVSHKYYP